MNRVLLLLLCVLSSAAFAKGGDSAPLCPPNGPTKCVVPNWGQIEPGATSDVSGASGSEGITRARSAPKPQMALQMMPTAATGGAMSSDAASSLKSVVSPQGLFPKETAALVSALHAARFHADGSIQSGEAAIRRAADAAARSAGDKYTLTLFIRVPPKLEPERSETLGKRVDTINALLGKPSDKAASSSPKT